MKKHYPKIKKFWYTALLFPFMFTFLGTALPTFIEHVAPLSYFVKVTSIEVSDLDCRDWTQEVAINRTVRSSLVGYPKQELKLYRANYEIQPVLETERVDNAVAYEYREDHLVLYTRDWSDKIPIEQLQELDTFATYYWVWDIDFEVSKYREPLNGRYQTNDFRILCED